MYTLSRIIINFFPAVVPSEKILNFKPRHKKVEKGTFFYMFFA